MSSSPNASRYPTLREYADAQREIGSCGPEFKATMIRALKVGAGAGVPFGVYAAYRMGHRSPRLFAGKATAVWLSTVMCFSCLGVIGGTFNCLRVSM